MLINGAGGSIGTFGVQIPKSMAAHVTPVDAPHKERMLRSIGADRFIDFTREDFSAERQAFDVVFDMVASSDCTACLGVLGSGGRSVRGSPALSEILRSAFASVDRLGWYPGLAPGRGRNMTDLRHPAARRQASRSATLSLLLPVFVLVIGAGCTHAAAPRTLYLVRHGEYDQADPRDAAVGKGLVPIGVAQARLLGARLRASGIAFDAFDASPLTRARQTALVLAEDLPGATLHIVPELAECTPPTRRTEIIANESPADLQACAERLDRVFAERFVPSATGERHELVVAHGNVIRYLVTKALGVDTSAWLEMSVHNASLTVVRVEADGRCKVLSVGDSGHLPPTMYTGATGDPERGLEVPGG